MARTRRLVLPLLPHHLILRGNNRRRLFSCPSDYHYFLWQLGKALPQRDCQLHALALMGNHVHLIVTPPTTVALSGAVKSFAQRYAQYRNRRRAASGKLFEERFRCIPIEDDQQLAVTTVYCELNPLRAGLVGDELDYRWTTLSLHAGRPERCRIPQLLWTPSAWYLGLGATSATRASRYLDWVSACRVRGLRPAQHGLIARVEETSLAPYSLRLERPDRTRAGEATPPYGAR